MVAVRFVLDKLEPRDLLCPRRHGGLDSLHALRFIHLLRQGAKGIDDRAVLPGSSDGELRGHAAVVEAAPRLRHEMPRLVSKFPVHLELVKLLVVLERGYRLLPDLARVGILRLQVSVRAEEPAHRAGVDRIADAKVWSR